MMPIYCSQFVRLYQTITVYNIFFVYKTYISLLQLYPSRSGPPSRHALPWHIYVTSGTEKFPSLLGFCYFS